VARYVAGSGNSSYAIERTMFVLPRDASPELEEAAICHHAHVAHARPRDIAVTDLIDMPFSRLPSLLEPLRIIKRGAARTTRSDASAARGESRHAHVRERVRRSHGGSATMSGRRSRRR